MSTTTPPLPSAIMGRPPRATTTLGEIRGDSVYPLEVFRQRTGLDTWAMRQARRAGLKVRRVGRRAFIIGADFLRYLESIDIERQ
jgi:hypothetical protein